MSPSELQETKRQLLRDEKRLTEILRHQEPYPVENVAILGGGITGLATAHYLARELPNTPITIYEASNRFGGWLNTQSVDVGTGRVVFEQGPRSLRPSIPNGLLTLDLVRLSKQKRLEA